MPRSAPSQPDLFSPDDTSSAVVPGEPLAELSSLLANLQSAHSLPWPDAAAAMVEERRALSLARLAGPEGERLFAAILDETERLFAASE